MSKILQWGTDVVYRAAGPIWRRLPYGVRRMPTRWYHERVLQCSPARVIPPALAELREAIGRTQEPSFLLLPTISWNHTAFQRPHQMARALAEAGSVCVFAEPCDGRQPETRSADGSTANLYGLQKIQERLYLLRLRDFHLIDFLAEGLIDAAVLYWPWQSHYVQALPTRTKVVYEMMDDHSLVTTADWNFFRTHEHWVRNADVMAGTAESIIADLRKVRPDVLFTPNGVRLQDWRLASKPAIPDDLAQARQAKTVVHYHGAVGPWFDWNLLLKSAEKRPDCSFVIIGYTYYPMNDDELRRRIAPYKNIYFLGAKPYEALSAYVAHSDVTWIPFELGPISHACSPVKLFEYMAAGKPTVAPRMKEILKYKSVMFCDDVESCVAAIDRGSAMPENDPHRKLISHDAETNTWLARARDEQGLVTKLLNATPRRALRRSA